MVELDDYFTNGKPNDPVTQGLGWPYQIMAYLEEATAQQNAAAFAGAGPGAAQRALQEHAIPLYNCPSRRGPTRPNGSWLICYAGANGGPTRTEDPDHFEDYLHDADDGYSNHQNVLYWGCLLCTPGPPASVLGSLAPELMPVFRGIIQRSGSVNGIVYPWVRTVKMAQVTDGTSNTLILGEKRLQPSKYETGAWYDDRGWAGGWDPDIVRSTIYPLKRDAEDSDRWVTGVLPFSFGGAHSGGMNGLFADGSVRIINYDIDREHFNRLGHRSDGELIDLDE